jgi:hypothetical protein
VTDSRIDEQRRANVTLLKKLGVMVVFMFGFGYALVPFYEKICDAPDCATCAADVAGQHAGGRDPRRAHRVRLQCARPGLDVQGLEPVVSVHPGEVRQVEFEVVNRTGQALTGQASRATAGLRRPVFPEDGVLLLRTADARGGRNATHAPSCSSSSAAAGRPRPRSRSPIRSSPSKAVDS